MPSPIPTRACVVEGEKKKKKKASVECGEPDAAVAATMVEVEQGSSKKAAKKAAKEAGKAAAKAAAAAAAGTGEQGQPQAASVVSLVPRTIALQQQPKGGCGFRSWVGPAGPAGCWPTALPMLC